MTKSKDTPDNNGLPPRLEVHVPRKYKFEDLYQFALQALNDPEVTSIIRFQIDSPPTFDEEIEDLEAGLSKYAREYTNKMNLHWEDAFVYKLALSITHGIMAGELDKTDRKAAKELISDPHLIEWI